MNTPILEIENDDDLEAKILDQMNNGCMEVEPVLNVSEKENVQEIEVEEIPLPTLTKQAVQLALTQITGFKFKFGEAVFEINYTNPSKKRFSATLLNDVE